MLSYTRIALQMLVVFCLHKNAKLQNVKLVYLPLLTVNNIGFLQHMLFGLVLVYVSVKILYFHQVLEQKNTKEKKLCEML